VRSRWLVLVATYPLYSNPEQKRPAEQLATLVGDLAYVDGKDVSAHGNSFELLPGCHVVGPPEKWGKVDYSHSIWANIGKLNFAIPMKARHRYVVRIDVGMSNGAGSTLNIVVREETMDGTVTRYFRPIKGLVPVEDCNRAAAATNPTSVNE